MNTRSFSGPIDVEPGTFDLVAKRFIIRDAEVAFEISGTDNEGEFSIEGILPLVTESSTAPTRLPFRYKGWNDTFYATITFESVLVVEGKCRLRAEWRQDAITWALFAELAPYGG